jgi:hypothetical protein
MLSPEQADYCDVFHPSRSAWHALLRQGMIHQHLITKALQVSDRFLQFWRQQRGYHYQSRSLHPMDMDRHIIVTACGSCRFLCHLQLALYLGQPLVRLHLSPD